MAVLIQSQNGQLVPKSSLAAAIASADVAGKTIVVTESVTLAVSDTVPVGTALRVENGGLITISSGQTLTINGSFECGLYQAFGGTGTVTFGAGAVTEVYPEWWGGNLQAAVDCGNNNPITVKLSYSYNGGITITKQNVTISGGEITGNVTVGTTGSPVEMFYEFSGVTFRYTSPGSYVVPSNTNNGITLHNARYGKISNCNFYYCYKAIEITSEFNATQHVNRLQIQGNYFYSCGYNVYSNGYDGTKALTVGDIDFSGNTFCEALIAHIYMTGQDGLTCINNTFYFPGFPVQSVDKTNNIYMDRAGWVIISNNNLFEAGAESISISHFRDTIITDNNIAWPGQNTMASGIKLVGGDTSDGINNNRSIISGNNISYPTLSGIQIESNRVGRSSVHGNVIFTAGESFWSGGYCSYYGSGAPSYPDTALSGTHYGIDLVDGSGQSPSNVLISDNFTPDNINSIPISNNLLRSFGNVDSTKNQTAHLNTLTLSGATTTITVDGYDRVNLDNSSPTTLTGITGGSADHQVALVGFSGNTTVPTSLVHLKGAVNVTIPQYGVLVIQYFSDVTSPKWVEISRNF